MSLNYQDLQKQISKLDKTQRAKLNRTIFSKVFQNFSSLQVQEKSLIKRSLLKCGLISFATVFLSRLSYDHAFAKKLLPSVNLRKYRIVRLVAFKNGIFLFLPAFAFCLNSISFALNSIGLNYLELDNFNFEFEKVQ